MADIRVPTLGESVTEATVGKWFKQPGDAVAVDEPLVELETDKVTLEVPAPAAGVLGEIAAKNGDTVGVGALLGQIKEGAGAAQAKPAAPTAKVADAPKVGRTRSGSKIHRNADAAICPQNGGRKWRRPVKGHRHRHARAGDQRRHAQRDRARRGSADSGFRSCANASAFACR